MKFALLSVTYGGLFYKGEALSLEQQIYKAKELGFDALAIETKRPVASPLDLTKADRERIKKISAAWPGIIDDEEAVAMYGEYERGNYYKRLFPADLRRWNRCVEGIREAADMA